MIMICAHFGLPSHIDSVEKAQASGPPVVWTYDDALDGWKVRCDVG